MTMIMILLMIAVASGTFIVTGDRRVRRIRWMNGSNRDGQNINNPHVGRKEQESKERFVKSRECRPHAVGTVGKRGKRKGIRSETV